jgi:hypothetical protein
MLNVKTLTLSALAAVAFIGAEGCIINNNDGTDGTGEGEGEGEGEDVVLLGQDEPCNLTRTDEICDPDQNLVCVQQGLNPNAGVCRPTCGAFDAQGAATKDPAITCPTGTTCQAVIPADLSLNGAAVVCAPQGVKNADCRAFLDEEACVEGDCIPLAISFDDAGSLDTIDALGCRVSCDADAAVSECAATEACIQGGRFGFQFDFDPELNAQGAPVTCTETLCEEGNAGCECGENFDCIQFGEDQIGRAHV